MKYSIALTATLAILAVAQAASATVITSVSWYASNHWAGKDWCEDECLDTLLGEMGDEDPSGTMTIRGKRAQSGSSFGRGSINAFIAENDGTRDRYCGYDDVMTVSFEFSSFTRGSVGGSDFILCGDSALGLRDFQPPQGEYGVLRGEIYGHGWGLTGYVESVSARVPEPGTLALLGLGLAGLAIGRRRSSG